MAENTSDIQIAHERIKHINLVLRAIRNVNKLIVSETEDHLLIQKACQALTENMGYFNAWIALLDEDASSVRLTASSGFNGGFRELQDRLSQGYFTSCMRKTLRQNQPMVIEEPSTNCLDCPLASTYGGRSGMTSPISIDGRTSGILSVSVPLEYAYDEEEQELFKEIADSIGFALQRIEAEEQSHRLNQIVSTIPQPMSFVSKDYKYLAVNNTYADFYGAATEQIVGKTVADFCGVSTFAEEIKPHLDRCLNGEKIRYEVLVDFPGKGSRWMEMTYTPLVGAEGTITGVISHGFDISDRKQAENELRMARQLSERIIEDGPVAITLVNRDGKIVFANRHAEQLFGLEKHTIETLGYNDPEWLINDIDGSPFPNERLPFHQVMLTGQPVYDIQHAITPPAAARKILSVNGAPLHDEQGRIDRVVFAIQDITERKLNEENRQKTERFLRQIIDAIPSCLIVKDGNGRFLLANRATALFYGPSVEDMIGKYEYEFAGLNPSNQEEITKFLADDRAVIESNRIKTIPDEKFTTRNGELRTFHVVKLPVTYINNEAGVLVVATDITEIKQTEEELRKSEERYRDVANAQFGMVWETDENFRLTHLSGRVHEILGYEPEEIIGRSPLFLIDPEDRERISAVMARHHHEREPIKDIEYWCRNKEGRRVRILTNGVSHFAGDGRFLGSRGTHIDITEAHWSQRRREIQLLVHEMSSGSDAAISAVLCEACAEFTDSPMAFFGMLEPGESAMMAHVWSPQAMAECRVPEKPQRFPIKNAGLWAEPIRSREPVIFNDYATSRPKRGLPDGHVPITRYLGVPIISGNNVIAVAGVANRATNYDDRHIIRLRLITSTITDFLSVRRKEQALRESDCRLRTFIDFTADWEYWLMPDGRHLYDSPSCEQISGYRPQDFQEDPDLIARIVHPEDRAVYDAHTCAVDAESEIEFRIIHKDGDTRWIQHRCRPILGEDGAHAGIRVSNRDITQRKQEREALSESEERFRTIYQRMSVGVARISLDFLIENANSAYCSMLGYTESELIGKHLSEITHQEKLAENLRKQSDLATGKIDHYRMEKTFVHKNGKRVYGILDANLVRDSKGNPKYFLGSVLDITERKRAEGERQKLQAQLQQAQKMEAIGTLTGGVAHDFNNLLQAINGYTQLLLMDKSEDDPEFNSLSAIQQSGKRAADLIRSLLLFSRKAETDRKAIELNQEVEQARRILERTIPKMIDIDIHLGSRLWTINADPVQMEQILLNLGTNAADAMPDGGKLTIETTNTTLEDDYVQKHLGAQPGCYVLLTISDTGQGMDKETMKKIFDPFFTTKEFGKGTGLGLASVYGIVQSHGGYINCYSEVGQGTTFKIYLPAIVQPEIEETKEVEAKPIPRGTETVLLVDDEEAIRGFAQQALMKFGYKVMTASTGEEALELYAEKSTEIDLVVMDLGMPGMGGHKCLQELLKLNPEVKVVIASGYSINGQVKQSMEAGAKGFVGKPYQLADLLNTVREVLDEEE